jgi:hypothetical protein
MKTQELNSFKNNLKIINIPHSKILPKKFIQIKTKIILNKCFRKILQIKLKYQRIIEIKVNIKLSLNSIENLLALCNNSNINKIKL